MVPGRGMQSETNTAKERLYKAVIALASGQGPVQERLAHAFISYLSRIEASAFPIHVRSEYEAIRKDLEKMYPEGARLDGMDQNQCAQLARRIIIVYDAVIK
jgi:hypothetical protein